MGLAGTPIYACGQPIDGLVWFGLEIIQLYRTGPVPTTVMTLSQAALLWPLLCM